MFHRIDLLPLYRTEERGNAIDRWETDRGRAAFSIVTELVRRGGGEDFLQRDIDAGNLPILKDMWDLRGFELQGEDIEFPRDENFESIDFSFARFSNTKFKNASFPQTYFGFARFINVTFEKCLFSYAQFYGCQLDGCKFVGCDFVEANGFANCDFRDTVFEDCFFQENRFSDCKFNERVAIRNVRYRPDSFKVVFDKRNLSGIYRGVSEAYSSGRVDNLAEEFEFLQWKAFTRHNLEGIPRLKSLSWEIISGYGLRPLRVFTAILVVFAGSYLWFGFQTQAWNASFVLAAGALLTFGANADMLKELSIADHVIYIGTAILGITLLALFVTVVTNVLLKRRG